MHVSEFTAGLYTSKTGWLTSLNMEKKDCPSSVSENPEHPPYFNSVQGFYPNYISNARNVVYSGYAAPAPTPFGPNSFHGPFFSPQVPQQVPPPFGFVISGDQPDRNTKTSDIPASAIPSGKEGEAAANAQEVNVKDKRSGECKTAEAAPLLTQSELIKGQLTACTRGSKLDIVSAGTVILNSIVSGENVNDGIEKFAEKYSGTIISFDYPNVIDPYDSTINSKLIYGFGCQLALLTKYQEKQSEMIKKTKAASTRIDLGTVRGSTQFIKNVYKITGDEVFKDFVIDVDRLDPPKRQETHLVLLHYLRMILKQITYDPADIQKFTKHSRKSSKPIIPLQFPDVIYQTLYKYFMEYFNFDHEELDVPWKESNQNIEWIENLGMRSKRQYLFQKLAQSKHNYTTYCFEGQLKAALSQLRQSTLEEDEEDGKRSWKMRKH